MRYAGTAESTDALAGRGKQSLTAGWWQRQARSVDWKPFFFPGSGECCNFPQVLFPWHPMILICVFNFIQLTVLPNFSFLWPMDYLEVFSFQIFRDFLAVFLYWFLIFSPILVREDTWYDLNHLKFIEFYLWLRRWSLLIKVSCSLEKMCPLLLVGRVFCKCWLDQVGW